MKRAGGLRAYRDAKAFPRAAGIVGTQVCDDSGQLSGPYCPNVHSEVFIAGTEPAVDCELHVSLEASTNHTVELPDPATIKHR
jgi:hypothetical protein